MENFIHLIEQCVQDTNQKNFDANLKFIQTVLNLIFDQIKKTDTSSNAKIAFALLDDIQFVLAKAAFKDKITLTPALNKFITDFDRIDDIDVRVFLYLKIKSNEYTL